MKRKSRSIWDNWNLLFCLYFHIILFHWHTPFVLHFSLKNYTDLFTESLDLFKTLIWQIDNYLFQFFFINNCPYSIWKFLVTEYPNLVSFLMCTCEDVVCVLTLYLTSLYRHCYGIKPRLWKKKQKIYWNCYLKKLCMYASIQTCYIH